MTENTEKVSPKTTGNCIYPVPCWHCEHCYVTGNDMENFTDIKYHCRLGLDYVEEVF